MGPAQTVNFVIDPSPSGSIEWTWAYVGVSVLMADASLWNSLTAVNGASTVKEKSKVATRTVNHRPATLVRPGGVVRFIAHRRRL